MKSRISLVRVLLSLLLTAMTAACASATCWICLLDGGTGQYYCQSVAGAFSSHCVPVWNEYCDITGSSYCPEDGCGCQRFPDPPGRHQGTTGVSSNLGILIFRGVTGDAQARLIAGLSEVPVTVEVGDELVTPDRAASALTAQGISVRADALELAGYVAVTSDGPTVSRLLGHNQEGFLVDARGGSAGHHVLIAQLFANSVAWSTQEVELAANRAVLCRVTLSGESFACVIWAQRTGRGQGSEAELHRRFIEAADTYAARDIVAMTADSPDLRLITFNNPRIGPSPWGQMAAYHR